MNSSNEPHWKFPPFVRKIQVAEFFQFTQISLDKVLLFLAQWQTGADANAGWWWAAPWRVIVLRSHEDSSKPRLVTPCYTSHRCHTSFQCWCCCHDCCNGCCCCCCPNTCLVSWISLTWLPRQHFLALLTAMRLPEGMQDEVLGMFLWWSWLGVPIRKWQVKVVILYIFNIIK